MELGDRNTLVRFERRQAPVNDASGAAAVWEQFAAGWCSLAIEHGGEPVEGEQRQIENTITLKTHWTPVLATLTAADRAVLAGERLGIRSVVDVGGQHRDLEVKCAKRVNS